ncbi:nucleotidyl transferase AbiEii/AbiGii toxin family protein [Neomicrococcus aestuarii]|uniref:Nucleotidyl transferase AbiEii/AbiGii toxin family protein n=1 Tax=Neomicrococcus aestuarii TaxID=556325 RepID=A0A1L2ZNX1_9MICC|nr:nucleotidyl transferase AbiEii/AbiGii toxin family protein [Neomicrococcus aestuarii]APF40718.1 hypothetical protein BHE16_06490 [Neomicrococcus aestuarii]
MPEQYASAAAVESAIRDAASLASKVDGAPNKDQLILREYFNRFLSRIFSDGESSEWVLKGGTGILARVPSTRSTMDIDLYREGFSLDEALKELRVLSSVDLDDHFRFEYVKHDSSLATDAQPYVDGCRVTFNIYLGVAPKGKLQVDLVTGSGMTEEATVIEPQGALLLPRLNSSPYRIHPVVDQMADKICATMTVYNGRNSSRVKDLVDLVVFATTQRIDGTSLSVAIDSERRRRRMDSFEEFVVPSDWGAGYAKFTKSVRQLHAYESFELAVDLVSRLIDPALQGIANGSVWQPNSLRWVPENPS